MQLFFNASNMQNIDNFVSAGAPSLHDACNIILEGLKRRRLIIVLVDCRVEYQGRASSTLDWGQRLIILKGDGAILVHRSTGHDAVNWQPPGSLIQVDLKKGMLLVEATRNLPRETLHLSLRSIYLVASMKMMDNSQLVMHLSEEQLYDAINIQPDLLEKGFRIISSQRHMAEGFADFTGNDVNGRYVIIEVKRRKADLQSVKQLYKYVSELRDSRDDVRGILAAPEITKDAKTLAKTLSLEFRKLDLKKCSAVLHRLSQNGQTTLKF